jgi:Alternative oxidase
MPGPGGSSLELWQLRSVGHIGLNKAVSEQAPAPEIAKHYWKMANDATLRDVVLVVSATKRTIAMSIMASRASLPVFLSTRPDDTRLDQ